MASFRFNIGSFNSKCENIRTFTSKYKNMSEQTFISAKSIKNSWNDAASEAFFEKVSKDEVKVSDIFNSLESFQRNLEFFGNEFSNIFSSKGIPTHNLTVDYNSSKISSAQRNLQTVKKHIRTAQKAFEDCTVPYGFDNLPILNEVFNALYNDIGLLANSIESDLNGTVNKINDLISTTKGKISYVPIVTIDDRLSQVSANTVYLTPKNMRELDKDFKVSISENGSNSLYDTEELNLNEEQKVVVNDYESQIGVDFTLKDNDGVNISGTLYNTDDIQRQSLEEEKERNISLSINDISYKEKEFEDVEEENISVVSQEVTTEMDALRDEEAININTSAEKVVSDDMILKSSEEDNITFNNEKVVTNEFTLNSSQDENVSFTTQNVSNENVSLKPTSEDTVSFSTGTSNVDTKAINLQTSGTSGDIDIASKSIDSNTSLAFETGETINLNTTSGTVNSTSMSLESAKTVDINDISIGVDHSTSVNLENGRKVDAQDILNSAQ